MIRNGYVRDSVRKERRMAENNMETPMDIDTEAIKFMQQVPFEVELKGMVKEAMRIVNGGVKRKRREEDSGEADCFWDKWANPEAIRDVTKRRLVESAATGMMTSKWAHITKLEIAGGMRKAKEEPKKFL